MVIYSMKVSLEMFDCVVSCQQIEITSAYNVKQVDLVVVEFLDLLIQGGYSRVGLPKKVHKYVLGRWDSGCLDGKWGGDDRKRI